MPSPTLVIQTKHAGPLPELLGIEERTAAAQAVIELRLRSFSQSTVAEVQSERDALRRRLDQGL
jgi:hypothetical protein